MLTTRPTSVEFSNPFFINTMNALPLKRTTLLFPIQLGGSVRATEPVILGLTDENIDGYIVIAIGFREFLVFWTGLRDETQRKDWRLSLVARLGSSIRDKIIDRAIIRFLPSASQATIA